jgi:hypothetical protein
MLGDGNELMFWTDPWLDGSSIAELVLDLLGAVLTRRWRKTVAQALGIGAWIIGTLQAL